MHSNLLIVMILTVGFALASFLGYVMRRFQLPLILGYLLAGYLIGPYSPGFVANHEIAEQLAEIGVILMLFGVGLHFKIEDLLRVKNVAIPGAIFQTLVATLSTVLVVYLAGWSIQAGLIMGLSIGVASTVVLVRLLTDNKIINTDKGHIAIGWLVVEDIFTVAILILLPTIKAISNGYGISILELVNEVFFVIGKFLVLAILLFTCGASCIDVILRNIARVRSEELFTLTILAIVFVVATGSTVLFGTSIALGAFIAGMLVGKSHLRHQAAANALPLKDIFSVIFFLSVGMLFNPEAILNHFSLFLGVMAIILLVKPFAAYMITSLLGYRTNVGLTVAVSLAQIGEFSFILAEEAMNLKIFPDDGFDLIVAAALVSISINPLLFQKIPYIDSIIQKWKFFKYRNSDLKNHFLEKSEGSKIIVVGYGPIGREAVAILKSMQYELMIIEENIDTVSLVSESQSMIFGNATEVNILKSAGIEEATHLLITIPETEKVKEIIRSARDVKPYIQIITRVQYISEQESIEDLDVEYVCTESEALKAYTAMIRRLFKQSLHRNEEKGL